MSLDLRQKLEEAEKAYHSLVLGKSAVEITDQNGEKVVYNRANRAALSQYIEFLKKQLGQTAANYPARVYF